MKKTMKVRFFDFSTYHGKNPPTGSTQIRVHQLIKYWEDADVYKYGEKPDVLIFQKVYSAPDYKFPNNYSGGLKILDLCDPDWFSGLVNVRESVDAVDAVTCSSENLSKFIRQFTSKPVVTIPDRFDPEVIPKPKTHTRKAKTVAWFGYRHNAETLKPAMNAINELGLSLLIISDDDPMMWQWVPRQDLESFKNSRYKYIKYEEQTFYKNIQKADFSIIPAGTRPEDRFKSNNRTVKSILAGLPVATNRETLENFIDSGYRKEYLLEKYIPTHIEYDVKKSVEQYKRLISQIS